MNNGDTLILEKAADFELVGRQGRATFQFIPGDAFIVIGEDLEDSNRVEVIPAHYAQLGLRIIVSLHKGCFGLPYDDTRA